MATDNTYTSTNNDDMEDDKKGPWDADNNNKDGGGADDERLMREFMAREAEEEASIDPKYRPSDEEVIKFMYERYDVELEREKVRSKDYEEGRWEPERGDHFDPDLVDQIELAMRFVLEIDDVRKLPENSGKSLRQIAYSIHLQKSKEYIGAQNTEHEKHLFNTLQALGRIEGNITSTTEYLTKQNKEKAERSINFSSIGDSLEEEIAKREKAVTHLEKQDQRSYGSQTLSAAVNLDKKKAELEIVKAIEQNVGFGEIDKAAVKEYLSKYIGDRENIELNLAKKSEKEVKRSDAWKEIGAERGKVRKRIDAAGRVWDAYLKK
jgi:hypothetical protein